MASLLESLSAMMTPEVVGTLSKSLGVDSSMVQKGLDVAGPLIEGSLAKKSSTTAGMDEIMKMLPEDGVDMRNSLSDLADMLGKGGPMGALASSGILNSVLGNGVSAIGKTLNASLGFDVTPLLAAVAPLVLGVISQTAKEQKLDSAGIAKMLQADSANTMANLKPEVQTVLNEAIDAGNQAEALQNAFPADEWVKLRLAPLAAAYYVMSASPSGTIGTLKEITAGGDAMKAVLKDASPTSLVNIAFGSLGEKMEGELKFDQSSPRQDMLNMIKSAAAAVRVKKPDEAQAFGDTLVTLATKVAEAAKEGGFLGIGGQQVSKEEQQALDEIRAAVA